LPISAAMTVAIVDTGPLVGFLDRAETHHQWVATQVDMMDSPLLGPTFLTAFLPRCSPISPFDLNEGLLDT
jgi:hypothetical protein